MGWFLFLMAVVCIVYLLFCEKNHDGKKSPVLTDEDDFNGGSTSSLFLLEDILDSGADKRVSVDQSLSQSEQVEDEYFEDEFFE
jgi:hypothetical protein